MNPGDCVELEIERLAAGGDGVARHKGRVVFVPHAAPGDRLTCRITEVRARYSRATIEGIRSAGPARRDPSCPLFGRCGGCTWMHIADEAQTQARSEILRDALLRIGRLRDLPPFEWIRSPRTLGYRALARVAYTPGVMGFRASGSHEVVDVERCAVLDESTQRELQHARSDPPEGTGELELRGFGLRALGLSAGPGAFFQANGSLWEPWAELVAKACGAGRVCVELYAGVGFYTRRLEPHFERVVAVERGDAARDLRENTRAQVHQLAAELFAPSELAALAPDVVLINPPRTGCSEIVIDALRDAAPRRIVYVSCDPATLARDLARLNPSAGGYRVSRVVGIDALPQTHHVEAIVVLDVDAP